MDGADQVVPIVFSGELFDESLAALEPIAFHSRADFHAVCGGMFRAGDPIEILRQLAFQHAPVIERLRAARRVIGDAVFIQSCCNGGLHVFLRRAGGVFAKRRVRVVVGGHCWQGCSSR